MQTLQQFKLLDELPLSLRSCGKQCVTESLVDWADLYGRNRCWGTAFWVDPFDSSAPRRLGNELFLDTWMQIPLLCLVAEYRGRARLEIQQFVSQLNLLLEVCLLATHYYSSVGSYLVDPASSHMLVSKIKPCMSKYKHLYCETANGSLNQLSFI